MSDIKPGDRWQAKNDSRTIVIEDWYLRNGYARSIGVGRRFHIRERTLRAKYRPVGGDK
jgi:hypothetical protein